MLGNRHQNVLGGGYSRHDFLFDHIVSLENLFLAWKEFRRGKLKKQDVQIFEFDLENNLFDLQQSLLNKTYRPDPYLAFFVSDPKIRHIHKAAVRDRVLHQAIFRKLYHLFDQHFIYDSYSCRLGRGTHRGVRRLANFARRLSQNYSRPVYALKCDIKKFFDAIDQNILLNLIKQEIDDTDVLWSVAQIVDSFQTSPGKGLPLGNVTSQLFANIYLNELDHFVKHSLKEKFYLRYCDDFLVLHNDPEYLKNLIIPIGNFLSQNLDLSLHPKKIEIRKISQGIDFLGYVTLPHYRVLRTKTKKRILKRLRQSNSLPKVSLPSYLGMLQHCRGNKLSKILTFWF